MRFISLLILALGATFCYADPSKVVVNGPSKAEPGQLIVLSAESPDKDTNYLWIPDSALGQVLQCNPSTIGMATPRVGIHKVIVVGSNTKGEMSYVVHVINIERPIEPEPDPVPDDPTPDPKPPVPNPPSFQDLYEVSKDGADKVNDPTTRSTLQNNLNRILPDIVKASSVDEAKKLVTNTVEAVLLLRTSPSRDALWFMSWRKPLFDKISKIEFKNTTEYSNAIKVVINGLSGAPLCIDCIK